MISKDVTEEMLNNVYVPGGPKIKIKSHNGTTCHQCRQKTKDQKTICRSGNCHGVSEIFVFFIFPTF